MKDKTKIYLSLGAALLISILLSIVQTVPTSTLLLLERLFSSGGWWQIFIAALYGGILCYKMQNRKTRPLWRRRVWLLFSIVFFGQLFAGMFINSVFLMTGKLHLPIPTLILAGPLYRMEGLFMPILFISTLLLSGPAWCSQLCYFGAFDAWNAQGKTNLKSFPYHRPLRYSILLGVIFIALLLRLIGADGQTAILWGLAVGVLGLMCILFLSRRNKKMIHCSSYCPIGTVVSFMKYLSPFRVRLTTHCTHCMACVRHCKYDALHPKEIEKGKIGYTCVYCGDCLSACKHNAIEYHFMQMKPDNAERLWILTTVVLHTCFLMIARI